MPNTIKNFLNNIIKKNLKEQVKKEVIEELRQNNMLNEVKIAKLQNDALILSNPTATLERIKEWSNTVKANDLFKSWLPIAWKVGIEYGVDPVFIIAQFAIETGYARFGGVVDKSYCNVCGLKNPVGGSDKDPNAHMKFESWEQGITAQVQHLALYAGATTLVGKKIVDPRHFNWIRGTAKTANQLSAKWATGTEYGEKINKLCKQIAK